MDIEMKYNQALDVIVGLSNDIKELKSKCIEWSAIYGESQREIARLKDELKQKETLDKNVKVLVRDQAEKVKHLFTLENTPGYGQLCEMVLRLRKALDEIRVTYEWWQIDNTSEVIDDAENICDVMYRYAVEATSQTQND